jgi:hypothetical protein
LKTIKTAKEFCEWMHKRFVEDAHFQDMTVRTDYGTFKVNGTGNLRTA